MTRILIRTAGGSGYGAGHIQRMKILAAAIAKRDPGLSIEFLVGGPEEALHWLEGCGFYCHALGEKVSIDSENEWLKKNRSDLYIIDLLHIDDRRLELYNNSHSPVILFSDMGYEEKYCSLVIQPQRLDPVYAPNSKLLVGPDYFIIAPEYHEMRLQKRQIKDKAQNLLISMGGECKPSSLIKLAGIVKKMASNWKEIDWIIGHDSTKAVDSLGSFPKNVRLNGFVDDMATRLQRADLAIIAGGFIKYDAACCGTPAVIIAQYIHQKVLGESFAITGVAKYLGMIDSLNPDEILKSVTELQNSKDSRSTMSESGKQLVDGLAVHRVVKQVFRLIKRDGSNL